MTGHENQTTPFGARPFEATDPCAVDRFIRTRNIADRLTVAGNRRRTAHRGKVRPRIDVDDLVVIHALQANSSLSNGASDQKSSEPRL